MLHLKRSTELLVQKLSDKEFLPLCWVKMQTVNIQTVSYTKEKQDKFLQLHLNTNKYVLTHTKNKEDKNLVGY